MKTVALLALLGILAGCGAAYSKEGQTMASYCLIGVSYMDDSSVAGQYEHSGIPKEQH